MNPSDLRNDMPCIFEQDGCLHAVRVLWIDGDEVRIRWLGEERWLTVVASDLRPMRFDL